MSVVLVAWLFAVGSTFFFLGCWVNLWLAYHGQ